ncbi:hypothetical protein J6590_008915 [Homalodisca vitripennis]|nr:hypothetical protein J6590_008915 [Homalodisca vitripennis]
MISRGFVTIAKTVLNGFVKKKGENEWSRLRSQHGMGFVFELEGGGSALNALPDVRNSSQKRWFAPPDFTLVNFYWSRIVGDTRADWGRHLAGVYDTVKSTDVSCCSNRHEASH